MKVKTEEVKGMEWAVKSDRLGVRSKRGDVGPGNHYSVHHILMDKILQKLSRLDRFRINSCSLGTYCVQTVIATCSTLPYLLCMTPPRYRNDYAHFKGIKKG